MGLAGNKQKQRIQDDPRNTRWATDTSAPGFRLLSSMGWTPSAPALGNASSQDLITAGGSTAYNKKISVIPTAKSDNLGIGARGGQGIGSMRAMGVPMGAMGFMAASAPGEVVHEVKEVKSGGEFGRLLERLNAASAAASAASSAAGSGAEDEGEKEEGKKEKKSKKDKDGKKRKRSAEDDEDSPATPITVDSPVSLPTASGSASPVPTAILHNPRNAARSKHLRSKRLATANNAAAMAEILGLPPPSSAPPAPVRSVVLPSSIASIPFQTKLEVSSPSEEGWPVAPARSFPIFASSGTGALAATWGGEVTKVEVTVVEEVAAMDLDPAEVEKERKRAKRERKELKRLKKEGGAVEEVVEEVDEVPVAAARKFPMFASASTTGLAATFVVEEFKEMAVDEVEVVEVDEAERKAAKKARKEEKRAKKAAAAAKA